MEELNEGVLAESEDSVGFPLVELDAGEDTTPGAEESPYTDDPVRVYLREMGSVSLLTRQGEVDLARRMERGKLRVQKVLSRSPLVREMAVASYQDLRQEQAFQAGDAFLVQVLAAGSQTVVDELPEVKNFLGLPLHRRRIDQQPRQEVRHQHRAREVQDGLLENAL